MDNTTILSILKQDLGISVNLPEEREKYLENYIVLSRAAITREGIDIQDNIEDGMLVEMYAAYLYRKRKEDGPMPRMLRLALNNRKLSRKVLEEKEEVAPVQQGG